MWVLCVCLYARTVGMCECVVFWCVFVCAVYVKCWCLCVFGVLMLCVCECVCVLSVDCC